MTEQQVDSTSDVEMMGPVDYLVVEFPGSKMTGEGLPLLVDLVDRGIIRILDLVFVSRDTDGNVSGVALADFDGDGKDEVVVGAFGGPLVVLGLDPATQKPLARDASAYGGSAAFAGSYVTVPVA